MIGSIDEEGRCSHYSSPLDIVAIKFPCCGEYYPCFQCHEEHADHPVQRWKHFDVPAILCGACKAELLIQNYLACNSTCPRCFAPFNPGCKSHFALYFDV